MSLIIAHDGGAFPVIDAVSVDDVLVNIGLPVVDYILNQQSHEKVTDDIVLMRKKRAICLPDVAAS
jgi:hypothetical protein